MLSSCQQSSAGLKSGRQTNKSLANATNDTARYEDILHICHDVAKRSEFLCCVCANSNDKSMLRYVPNFDC